MRSSLAIARKDFRDIFRERTIVLALVLQLFVAAFSSFLLVGLVSLYDPSKAEARVTSTIAYVGPGDFAERLRSESRLTVVVADQSTAYQYFSQGRVDAVLEELYLTPEGPRTINLLLPRGELETTLLVTLLKDHLRDYERDLRAERAESLQTTVVYVEAPGKASPFFAFAYALLVPLLLIVPVFVSGAIAADAVTQEIQTRTLELLQSSPASARSIFLGKSIAPIILAPAQAVLWMVLLGLNGIPIHNAPLLLVLLGAISVLLVTASVLFGLWLKKEGDAQVAYSLFVLLLFAATYLLPQPILSTIARLAVGSTTGLELGTLLGTVVAAGGTLAVAMAVVQRLLPRRAI